MKARLVIKFLRELFFSHKNQKGFTLVEVMIAAAMMGGLALVMMQIMKSQTSTSVQSNVDADVSQLKTEIQAILNNPAHCNANFYNMAADGADTPTASIKKCNSYAPTACISVGASGAVISLTVNTTDPWAVNTYSKRVRVTNILRNISSTALPAGNNFVLTTASLKVTIEKKTLQKTSTEELNFNNTVIKNATTVVGCPKSWNSTVPY